MDADHESIDEEKKPLLPPASVSLVDSVTAGGFRAYKRRWYILFVFSLLSAHQSHIWLTFGVIPDETSDYYGVDQWQIDLLAAWGPIIYIPMVFFTSWLLQTHGLRTTVRLGSVLIMLSAGIRCFPSSGGYWFTLVHLGQILNAAVGPIVMSAPPKLSSDWFGVEQRTTATAISTIANGLGVAVGFLVVPALVKYFDHAGLEGVRYMLFVEFWWTVAIALPIFVYFPARPPSPPSRTSTLQRSNFLKSLKGVSTNWSFWILCVCGGVSQGVLSGWSSVLSIILNKKSGYNNLVGVHTVHAFFASTAWLGFTSTFIGMVTGLAIGPIADHFPGHFKAMILFLFGMSMFFFTWFALSVYHLILEAVSSVFISAVLGCAFLGAANPLFYEAAVEVTYPMPEGTSAGMLTLMNNIGCLLFQIIGMADVFTKSHPERAKAMNWVLVLTVILCWMLAITYKEDYRRRRIDCTNQPLMGSDPSTSTVN